MAYSYTAAVGDGSTTTFTFSFAGPDEGYYDEAQVKVYVNLVEAERTLSGPNQVTLSIAPAASEAIMIVREPDITDTYTNFARGNNFGKDNLNRAFQQTLYLIQRIQDGFYDVGSYLKQALNMGNHKITNLAAGTNALDAINKTQYDVAYTLATEQSALSEQYAESASLSASEASGFKDEALSSASSAAASAASAAAAFDSFDSRYLGAFAADPLVDNDGDPLIIGALYFNTVTHMMNQYTGTEWTDVPSSVTSDNIIYNHGATGASDRTLSSKLKDYVNVKDFGAIGDGAANNTAAMQAAHNTGKIVYYPEGHYLFTSITISSGGLVGEGLGLTKLICTNLTTASAITFTGTSGDTQVPRFNNFSLEPSGIKAGGAGIHFNPASSELSYVTIDNVSIYNMPTSLYLHNCSHYKITRCNLINYSIYGIYLDNTNNPDSGDGIISKNLLTTGVAGSGIKSVYLVSGMGLKFEGNKILGSNGGFILSSNVGTQTGPLIISNNSIENVAGYAIYLGNIGAGGFGGIVITGNEIAVCNYGFATDNTGKFSLLTFVGNYIDLNNSTGTCMYINATNFLVDGNTFQGGSEGLRVSGSSVNGKVGTNQYRSNTTPIINDSATTFFNGERQKGTASVTHSTAFGSLFYGTIGVAFPTPFKDIPDVHCNSYGGAGVSGGFGAYATNISKTGFTLNMVAAATGITTAGWSALGVL